jgi:uncharacterized alpha-E superfamily protein
LLTIVGADAAYAERHPGADVTARRAVNFMIQDRRNPGSLYGSLRLARENARAVRDRISKPMWEGINELWLYTEQRLQGGAVLEQVDDFLYMVRKEVALFHGLTVNTMMRGQAFAFYLLGTFIERADMTARLLDVKYHLLLPDTSMVGSALDYYQWAALLKSISGFEAYRRHYHATFRPVDVADFVLFEQDFPRSLAFSVERMAQALEQLDAPAAGAPSQVALHRLRTMLADINAESVFTTGLHEFLTEFLDAVDALNVALQTDYFESYLGTEEECVT